VRSDPTFWILARASGLLAYALLTSSILAGIVLKARPFGAALKAATVTDLHRFLALLGLGFIVLHAAALVLDSSVHVSIAALFVPGLLPYRTLWSSLGVLAGELMLLVYVSFALRRRHRPRPRSGNRQRQTLGARALRRGCWRGHRCGRLASTRPCNQRRQHPCTG
jgi:hypothetical protein